MTRERAEEMARNLCADIVWEDTSGHPEGLCLTCQPIVKAILTATAEQRKEDAEKAEYQAQSAEACQSGRLGGACCVNTARNIRRIIEECAIEEGE